MEQAGPAGFFSKPGSSEKTLGLLYTVGFRLTGDHREAAGLVKGVISIIGVEGNLKAALKGLSRQYTRRSGEVRDREVSPGSRSLFESRREQLFQEALLRLPPEERLVVVLRDVLGLNYSEIGEIAGLEQPAFARLLAAGRRRLADLLIPHIKQGGCYKDSDL